jgi:Rab-GTPase-TBC domain
MDYLRIKISPQFKEVLRLATHTDPNTRCDVIDLIHHPFFKTVPCPLKQNTQIHSIYYLWLKYKSIDSIQKFEHYLIANGLLPYLPPVLQIPTVLESNTKDQVGITILKTIGISIESLLQEIKKDQDIESLTVETYNESKLFSDEVSIKQESFIGKLGTFFRSKSAKSTHSESSMRSKSDSFSNTYKKYKKLLNALYNSSEFIPVTEEGFPAFVRQSLWKKFLAVPSGYIDTYQFLYMTRHTEINKQISLDIPRCHQYNLFLSSEAGKKRLENLLKIWFSQHIGIKYSQGLDSIAAVCVCCFEDDEPAAYHCFDLIVKKYLLDVMQHEELIGSFLLLLRNLVSFIDPVLSQHLNTHNINPEMYATSWLLTLYSRNPYTDMFSLSSIYSLWDLMLQKPPEFIFFIAFSILIQFRKEILESTQSDIITLFSGINGHIDLKKCMKDAVDYSEKIPLGICKLIIPGSSSKPWDLELNSEVAQSTRSPMISLEDCINIFQDAIFIDTRASDDYNKLRVNGSINLPLKTGDKTKVLPTIKLTQAQLQGLKTHAKGKIIVLIGDSTLKVYSVTPM